MGFLGRIYGGGIMSSIYRLINKSLSFGILSVFLAFSTACSDGFSAEIIEAPGPQGTIGTDINADDAAQLKVKNSVVEFMNEHLEVDGSDASKFRSAIVGVIHNGTAPTASTVYPLNSITKMLTGIIMAKGEIDGDFSKSNEIGTLLNNDLQVDVTGVTLGMLVGHHSGLGFLPSNGSGSGDSPYSSYSRSNLGLCLSNLNCSFQFPIGESYHYSNIGIGLLGLGLIDHYSLTDFEELFSQKIGMPLNLSSTHVNDDAYTIGISTNIVKGRSSNGRLIDPAKMGVLAGAGALLSSGSDMLKVLEMLVAPKGQWNSVMQKAQDKLGIINDSRSICYGFDSYLNGPNEVFAKSGGQAGYSSYIVWSPSLNSGVFILTDQANLIPDLSEISDKIIDSIQESNI